MSNHLLFPRKVLYHISRWADGTNLFWRAISNRQCLYQRVSVLIIGLLLPLLAGCGRDTTPTPLAVTITDPATPTVAAVQAAAPLPAGCDEFFPICNTVTISGAVTAEGSIGSVHKAESCAAWAAGANSPRILELPFFVGAGESKITLALTRIGQYTGPGTYTLAAQSSSGMPDMFPTIEVAGRAFSNGEGSAATVTVAADGSGTIEATGLVEIASVQISNPDPDARIDFTMTWTCKE